MSGLDGGRSAGAGSGTRPSPKSQERSVALPQTMPGSELTFSPFLLQQPSASEPGETGQNSWQAPNKTCYWAGSVWHFQRLSLSQPSGAALSNQHVPNPPPFLRSRSPKMAPSCPVVQQHDRPLSCWRPLLKVVPSRSHCTPAAHTSAYSPTNSKVLSTLPSI